MDQQRRLILSAGSGLAAALATLSWTDVAAAAAHAHAAARSPEPQGFKVLTPAQVACVVAIAARIVPTDDLPGATEAGVVHFIDRGLDGFLAGGRADFLKGLADFDARVATAHPGAGGFAALDAARQDEFLAGVTTTPFFGFMRFLTVCGLLASPAYGGNRDGVGWQLIGFEEAHEFTPPFGYYDRDYPGFQPYPKAGQS